MPLSALFQKLLALSLALSYTHHDKLQTDLILSSWRKGEVGEQISPHKFAWILGGGCPVTPIGCLCWSSRAWAWPAQVSLYQRGLAQYGEAGEGITAADIIPKHRQGRAPCRDARWRNGCLRHYHVLGLSSVMCLPATWSSNKYKAARHFAVVRRDEMSPHIKAEP